MLARIIADYNEAVFDTDRERALQIVRDAERQGISPEDLVFQVVLPAMDAMVNALSDQFAVNLAQHFMTAQISDAVTAEMIPKFRQAPEAAGRVVIGTAYGDMHTLGKRMVIGCLRARMVDVTDLGVNVAAERFVEEALAHDARVIAISALMLHTATGELGCRKVRRLLHERGLEDRIKIMVGGAPFRFHDGLYRIVGADAWAPDAISAGKAMAELLQEVKK